MCERDGFPDLCSSRWTDGMVDIWAGCTSFPKMRRSGGEVELLEIERNSTFNDGNAGLGNVTVAVSGMRNNTGY